MKLSFDLDAVGGELAAPPAPAPAAARAGYGNGTVAAAQPLPLPLEASSALDPVKVLRDRAWLPRSSEARP